jgi:IS4 transposase
MDRGFLDFERLYRFHEAGSFFVTRGKSNLKVQRRYSHPVDRETGLICDQSVVLTGCYSHQGFEAPLRRIRFKDPETAKTLIFLTNNFVWPAFTITELYRCRWQVELFFDNSTWCTPSYVMEFQEPAAWNPQLVGSLGGFVRPYIVRRLLCA